MAAAPFHSTTFAMNTRLSFVLPGVSHVAGAALAREITAYVDEQEWLLSRFKPGPLGQLNAAAYKGPVKVSEALWDVLWLCREHSSRTDGLFDITMAGGPLPVSDKAWGMDKVEFDDANKSIRFLIEGIGFNLGAIGKGIALRGIMALLKRQRVDQAFVSFGDSSISVLGEHPAGGPWPISLTQACEVAFNLEDEALSVSGQDKARPHIVDPHSGKWVNGGRLLAVAGACPIETEVLSTALLVAAPRVRRSILDRYKPVRAIEVSKDAGIAAPKAKVMWRVERPNSRH